MIYNLLNSRKNSLIFNIGFVLIFASLWVLINFDPWAIDNPYYLLKGIGSLVGVIGYCLFSLSLFLSSRLKKLEDWFGGLDKIYRTHHQIGILGFLFILIHPLILSLKWIPYRLDKFYVFLFPIHWRTSVNLGSYSYWLMIIILLITILKLLPYDKWKITHKFMSVVFILASLHFLLSDHLFGDLLLSKALLCIPMAVGIFSIIYKQIFCAFIKKLPIYKVTQIKKLNHNTLEVFLKPKTKALTFTPGQYGFFSFQNSPISQESHPFTFCGDPSGTNISILIKARGDFTKALYHNLTEGSLAKIEGPYGRFDFMNAKDSQVWIAGGIGIVPFLTWARLLHTSKKIDLYYCVHSEKDAIFLNEFQKISTDNPQFRIFFFCSENKNRLNAKKVFELTDQLKKSSVLMCGPKKMTNDLSKQFTLIGVKKENIVFEDFEFF